MQPPPPAYGHHPHAETELGGAWAGPPQNLFESTEGEKERNRIELVARSKLRGTSRHESMIQDQGVGLVASPGRVGLQRIGTHPKKNKGFDQGSCTRFQGGGKPQYLAVQTWVMLRRTVLLALRDPVAYILFKGKTLGIFKGNL